jgi:hypothetical protein
MDIPATDSSEETGLVDVSDMSLLQIMAAPDPALRKAIKEMINLMGDSMVSQGWNNYMETR